MKSAKTPDKVAAALGVPWEARDVDAKEWRKTSAHIRAMPTLETFDARGRSIALMEGMGGVARFVRALGSEAGRKASAHAYAHPLGEEDGE